MNDMRRFPLLLVALGGLVCTSHALELIAPKDGSLVPLLPEGQKAVLALPTQDERRAKAEALGGKTKWREAAPLELVWVAAKGEEGPWKIRIGERPDLAEGADFYVGSGEVRHDDNAGQDTCRYRVPRPNLELGKTYYWRVWSNIRCKTLSCGSAISATGCDCGKTPPAPCSAIASFVTEEAPPRWIAVEGRTNNARDLGGWRTRDGGRVRQGMAFRGEAFNDNSVNGDKAGRNRLTVADVEYLTSVLGIKTDLDLRTPAEVGDMKSSPLGPSVKFIHHSAPEYASIFRPKGMNTMAANFRVFADRANYPIYFHCIMGADRTGSLAYVLNGVLGVDQADLERDWESTFYPKVKETDGEKLPHRTTKHFDNGFAKYAKEGDTLKDRIEAYLRDCGVTAEEIASVRAILLEDGK